MLKQIFTTLFCSLLIFSCESPVSTKKPDPTPSNVGLELIKNTGKILEKSALADVPFKIYNLMSVNPVNINFSPLSLKLAFALIYPGTDGDKKSQLEQIFGFNSNLADSLKANFEEPEALIANSVWVKNKSDFLDSYLNSLKPMKAELKSLNLGQMNEWVKQSTHGKIAKIIEKLDSKAVLVAINAIYFKALWKHPFTKEQNVWGKFQSSPYATKNTEMMHISKEYKYFENENSQWIELPYQNSNFSMLVGLPKKRFDLRSLEDSLGSELMKTVTEQSKVENVELVLPKFKFDQKVSLKDLLFQAGYGTLFQKGDFGKMSHSKDLVISDVVQATALEVNESGTEAAAATAVSMTEASIHMGLKKKFYADQPFVFLIQNQKTHEIYFLGRVYQP